jgi:predicted nicotinamide N-methyase
MGDNREKPPRATTARVIASYGAVCRTVAVGGTRLAFWHVDDLERYVDRAALLAGSDRAEPPYWAYCWSGARVVAEAIPERPGRVVELGCGLGLAGLVAARRGGRVLFVDREPAPLPFVRASLASNGLAAIGVVAADFTGDAVRGSFDLVLAADVLYDRPAFPRLVARLDALLAAGGTALVADGHRIDTREFYDLVAARGLATRTTDVAVREEGTPLTVTIATIRHP